MTPSTERQQNDDTSNPIQSWIRRVVKVRPGEFVLLLWAAAYFFFLLCSYYVLRPLRDALGTAGGVEEIKWLFSCTLLAMLVLNPVFSWLVSRYRRESFIPIMYGFFAFNIFIFYLLFRDSPDASQVYIGRTFYVWTAIFSLFIISVFWGLMVDLFDTEQAKRLFGFISVGGTLGAISGSSITRFCIDTLGIGNLFLVSIALLLMSVICMRAMTRRTRSWPRNAQQSTKKTTAHSEIIGGSAWSGIILIFKSPYLIGISLFMVIYGMTYTFLYLAKIEIGLDTIAERTDRIAFFANIDLFANGLTILVELFITSRLLTRVGIGGTLAILPGLSVIGFGILAWSLKDLNLAAQGAGSATMAALVITGLESIRRASNYALARPAREALYTVLGREEKYKSKSFIDTFFFRGGDQVGVWSHALMSEVFLYSAAAISLALVPLAGVWLCIALLLGRKQVALSHEQEGRISRRDLNTSDSS
ncbi:MAG: MFS transporter [Planctomycetota bacterium]|nr:MFS transporter [Planctomycetota bacterium]